MKLKKIKKTNYANTNKPSKPRLRSQTQNPLNSRFKLNQEVQFLTNLMFISQIYITKNNK